MAAITSPSAPPNTSGLATTAAPPSSTVRAKFESSGWALKKDGKFEVAPSVSGALMDEVIVCGLAMLELQRRRKKNASAGGAGGGGGC